MELHIKMKRNEKVCCAHDLGSYAQGQGRSQVRGQNRVSIITSKTTEANLTQLHRKIEHNEKVCHVRVNFLWQSQGHNQVRGQIVRKIMLLIKY